MRALKMILCVAVLAALVGCPGVGVGVSCKRNADGSVECSIDAHRDGNHEKPVK